MHDATLLQAATPGRHPQGGDRQLGAVVVGHRPADHHRASLVVDALTMAADRGRLQPGCITHSDRGSEYISDELRREISRLGLRQSMGRTGSCYDNAAAESFFALLKAEIGTRCWPDRTTARAEIFAFVETFYNRRRLRKHPAWGYLTPLEIRQLHEQGHALAA
ncbi:DDE-type integrase/transposase/recombinase [Streptomyces sp. NPDC005017]|uniref:DDE-type integrase/transposase/recombinase n=1 Tax=Streptomyces sp. NPDC005017 TaxID=3364706 RepID=UPI00368ED34B